MGQNEVLPDFACELVHGRIHGARLDLVKCLHAIWRKNIMTGYIQTNRSYTQMTHLPPSGFFPSHLSLCHFPSFHNRLAGRKGAKLRIQVPSLLTTTSSFSRSSFLLLQKAYIISTSQSLKLETPDFISNPYHLL